ncbi:MAG TPA: 1-deoxy-D-xylulose-5-phosphate reductoisomerase [Ignavibacteria bacterium]
MKNIAIFGSTGSIGVNSLNVIRNYPDRFKVVCLSTNKNYDLIYEQAREFNPQFIIITDKSNNINFRKQINNTEVLYGREWFEKILKNEKIDILINSLVGFSGLEPTIIAIKNNIKVALANKESLVTGGELINKYLKEYNNELIPIDSEHSAILQCLVGEKPDTISKLILTASGGPFLNRNSNDFETITVSEALNHPNWKMGNKITIDSATLMNKGLEVIEAKWLFEIPLEKIEVIIHPQSIIHSMVEFIDGSIKAQLGIPDMKIPIQYALTYPDRLPNNNSRLNFLDIKGLHFYKPDLKKFRCLKLAYDACKTGGSAPTIMNAANEIAVDLFLKERINFNTIPDIIEDALSTFPISNINDFNDISETDKIVREQMLKKFS